MLLSRIAVRTPVLQTQGRCAGRPGVRAMASYQLYTAARCSAWHADWALLSFWR